MPCLRKNKKRSQLSSLLGRHIKPGKIIEWGLPHGKKGRVFPILYLRDKRLPSVWVYSNTNLTIYPPTWASHGVDLARVFFVKCDDPLTKLKPIFLEDTFKLIVLDSPKKLSNGDLAFLARKTRENKQILFIIRNYFLSPKVGNPFASIRVNCFVDREGTYEIKFVKGKRYD